MKLAKEIESLAPFGKNNERPLFAEQDMEVLGYRVFGKNMNVMKMKLRNSRGQVFEVKYFRPDEFEADINRWFTASECDKMKGGIRTGCKLDIAYELDINEYNGTISLDFLMKEYEPA
jgi:single-stranded-DNA-specific exonuclease